MILETLVSPAATRLSGEEGSILIPAGQKLVIETSPGGSEILDETVPANKKWTVSVGVNIHEEDA